MWLPRIALSVVGIAWLTAVAGCDPGFVVEGSVVDRSGRPVANAEISLRCDGAPDLLARTDEQGRFGHHGIGWRPEYCFIDIKALEGPVVSFPIMQHCAKPHGDRACLTVKIDATLPEGSAPALAP